MTSNSTGQNCAMRDKASTMQNENVLISWRAGKQTFTMLVIVGVTSRVSPFRVCVVTHTGECVVYKRFLTATPELLADSSATNELPMEIVTRAP